MDAARYRWTMLFAAATSQSIRVHRRTDLAHKHKTAIAVHQDDFTKLEAALLLPLARIISGDVVASEESERVDSEAIQGPIAVSGNEHEPVRAVFFQ